MLDDGGGWECDLPNSSYQGLVDESILPVETAPSRKTRRDAVAFLQHLVEERHPLGCRLALRKDVGGDGSPRLS